jgi:acyl-CoA thioester hydrolase
LSNPVFVLPVRIYYEDTDAGGVVYHASYLRFMERARTEWLRKKGFELDKLAQEFGFLFAVRSACIDFLKPARLNDLLDIHVLIARAGKASLDVEHEVYRERDLLCRADIKLAGLAGGSFRPMAIPFDLD